ncbi:MAG: hypothetical protein ABR979_01920 [Halobacteriota archaeon]|jgi:hypothetical protein
MHSPSRLRQVATLQGIYGPDLLRDLSEWKWNYPPAGDSAVWASILLNALRHIVQAIARLVARVSLLVVNNHFLRFSHGSLLTHRIFLRGGASRKTG